jgi:hypothetical protein
LLLPENVMQKQIAIVLLAALLALPASAERRRAAAPVIDDALSIVFVDAPAADGTLTAAGGEAWLDVKEVANHAGSHVRGSQVRRRFGVRVVRAGNTASGTAMITARLESSDGRSSMRLDGKPLTEAVVVVDAHATIGSVAFHVLEIDVSDTIAPGPIAASITWEVTAQ